MTAIAAGFSTTFLRGTVAVATEPHAANATPFAPGKHTMVPLPFDPKKLAGLSEKLLVSHHENNYGGALKNLNKVEEDLAKITKATPGYLVASLCERELNYSNSVALHELYFGNLGGHGKIDGNIATALSDEPGGLARWEEVYRCTGMSLGGASGWVVLLLNLRTGTLQTSWASNHTQALTLGAPLLVMDMYEHAYQIDFGAAAARYIDAFFANIHWDEVNRRHDKALAALRVLRG